ncbi:MAG: transcriptional regulator, partial [Bacteroidetes bacterium]|nr:transcriptional regulator [Bacteroidota bacterium]
IYKAAAQELIPEELSKHQLESFVIKKGEYVYIDIKDYMKNVSAIGDAFSKLISLPNIDPNGCCVECYRALDEVRCMVRLNN